MGQHKSDVTSTEERIAWLEFRIANYARDLLMLPSSAREQLEIEKVIAESELQLLRTTCNSSYQMITCRREPSHGRLVREPASLTRPA